MGIEMIPVSKEVALRNEPSNGGLNDLAVLSRIKTDKPLERLSSLASARFRFKGADFSRAPNGGHQSLRKEGQAWIVQTHPLVPDPKAAPSIAKAAKGVPSWTKAGLHVPSDDPDLKKLAKEVVGASGTVPGATRRIAAHVNEIMRPNPGIGVLRNAKEVLATKEGVCRDYAILTVTLLRAANVPSRLVSGLVYDDGAFYYHAWVEAYDGRIWFGVDSTRPDGAVTAGHIKLAHGSVEDVFLFSFLDGVTVEVLGTSKKQR
jgi:transglutaminase-like putative cysteine protease